MSQSEPEVNKAGANVYREIMYRDDLPTQPEVVVEVPEEIEAMARAVVDEPNADMWEVLTDLMNPQMTYELQDGTKVNLD